MHARHRRLDGRLRTAAAAVAAALPVSVLAVTSSPASAAPVPVPVPVNATATTSASLLDATILGVALPAPLPGVSAASVEVAPTSGSLGGGSPRVAASAANLGADALGINLSQILSTAAQTAPADNADPDTDVLGNVAAAPVLTTGVSTATAHARFAGDGSCLPAATPLSSSTTTTADPALLTVGGLGALVSAPGTVETHQEVRLDSTGGAGDPREVVATTSSNLAELDLFGSVSVEVSSDPVLTARASGTPGGASVSYTQPVVTIDTPGGTYVLDAANDVASFAVPGAPLTLELSLGALNSSAAADGTSATGSAALLDLRLATNPVGPVAGAIVAAVGIVEMTVAAGAPQGGIVCDDGPATGAIARPDITSPGPGQAVTDSTPVVSGTGLPGASVTVREGGSVLCHTTVSPDGTWSCSPGAPLSPGAHTVTATQTSESATSDAASVSFSVVPAANDTDGDGLSNAEEIANGSDPQNPDSDGDRLTDGAEVETHGTDPNSSDSDGDRLADGQEVNGVKIRQRFEACGRKASKALTVETDPLRKDTDRDGLRDDKEAKGYKVKQRVKTRKGSFVIGWTRSNPAKKDTDRDGLKDRAEVTGKANKRFGKAKTDPTRCDTDRGGVSDGAEVRARANPADFRSGPRNPGRRSGRTPIG